MGWEFLSVVQCNPMPCIGGGFNNRQDDASTKFYACIFCQVFLHLIWSSLFVDLLSTFPNNFLSTFRNIGCLELSS